MWPANVSGRRDRQDERLTGPSPNQAGHCPLNGRLIFWDLLLLTLFLYHHVSPCVAMYRHVSPCTAMYLHIFSCITMYCNVSPFIPCHRKYSQSECRKIVVFSTVLYPTFPWWVAILFPPKYSMFWRYIAIHGDIWRYMAMHADTWQCMVINGNAWRHMVIYGDTWLYMAMHDDSWWLVIHGETCENMTPIHLVRIFLAVWYVSDPYPFIYHFG